MTRCRFPGCRRHRERLSSGFVTAWCARHLLALVGEAFAS